jgi:hypothetical protein
MKIEDIDPNFKPTSLNGISLVFMNALQSPFEISGVVFSETERRLRRISEKAFALASEGGTFHGTRLAA